MDVHRRWGRVCVQYGAMICSSHLKNQARLRDALSKAMSLVLPPAFVPHFQAQLLSETAEAGTRLPARTTLYRHRLSIACGLYVHVAQRHHNILQSAGFGRYLAVDKSPQGGRDWLMVIETCIGTDNLRTAKRQAARLVRLSRRTDSSNSESIHVGDVEDAAELQQCAAAAELEEDLQTCMEELSKLIQVS